MVVVAGAAGQRHRSSSHIVNWLSPRKVRETVATGEKGALVADTLTG